MNGDIFSGNKSESRGFNLWQVYNIWHRLINQELDTVKITHIQFVLLAAIEWLNERESAVTQIQVAQFAKVDVMMTSTVLRTLESKGLIIRKEHKSDTRAKCVVITDDGKEKLKETLKIVEKVDSDFFAPIDNDRNLFIKMLLELEK